MTSTVTRVNSASISAGAASTTATATIPAGTHIAAGDLIIACAASQTGHTANGISVQDSANNAAYTTLTETQVGGASTRWMQTFWYVTPAAIPDGTTITCTGYATATNTEFSLDVFRGTAGNLSRAVQGASNPSGGTSAAPALTSAPQAGDLVLTFCHDGSGTLTPASPFTKGSSGTTGASTAIGYILAATGSLTYASTWTLGTTNPSAAQTAAFAAAAWTPLLQPVAARLPHPPPAGLVSAAGTASGRTAWNPGSPARNPTPGPVFRQATSPARIRPALPPRGRAASNPGGPVRNPVAPAYPLHGPAVPASRPLPVRGRTASNPGGPLANPHPGPVYPLHGPAAAAARPLPSRGRTAGSPGAPLANPHPGTVYPLHGPAAVAYRPLPPRGRTAGSRGAPVRNPRPGPVTYPLHGPVGNAHRAPGPYRKGSTQSNPGAPVYHGAPKIRTGIPATQWTAGTPGTQWNTP